MRLSTFVGGPFLCPEQSGTHVEEFDIPGHRGIPKSELQGIQPGVLQVTQIGYRLSCLLPEGLGHNVVRRAATGVAELVGHLCVGRASAKSRDAEDSQ
jgi:hypothetical protein